MKHIISEKFNIYGAFEADEREWQEFAEALIGELESRRVNVYDLNVETPVEGEKNFIIVSDEKLSDKKQEQLIQQQFSDLFEKQTEENIKIKQSFKTNKLFEALNPYPWLQPVLAEQSSAKDKLMWNELLSHLDSMVKKVMHAQSSMDISPDFQDTLVFRIKELSSRLNKLARHIESIDTNTSDRVDPKGDMLEDDDIVK